MTNGEAGEVTNGRNNVSNLDIYTAQLNLNGKVDGYVLLVNQRLDGMARVQERQERQLETVATKIVKLETTAANNEAVEANQNRLLVQARSIKAITWGLVINGAGVLVAIAFGIVRH